jgi:hypothetical protein
VHGDDDLLVEKAVVRTMTTMRGVARVARVQMVAMVVTAMTMARKEERWQGSR